MSNSEYSTCRDCGENFDWWEEQKTRRADVCNGCYDRRGALLKALEARQVSLEVFQGLQKKMARGRGTAKAAIVSVLAKVAPSTDPLRKDEHGNITPRRRTKQRTDAAVPG